MWMLLAAAVGLVVLCSAKAAVTLSKRRHKKDAPGPRGYPYVGNYFDVADHGNFHKKAATWGSEFGNVFQFNVFGRKSLVISSAETLTRVLQDESFSGRLGRFFQPFVFNGYDLAFADYDKAVRDLRSLFHAAVYWRGQTDGQTLEPAIQAAVRRCLETQGRNFDPDPVMRVLLTDIHTILLIGETIPEDDPDHKALWELIDWLYTLLEPGVDGPLKAMPFLRFLPGKHGNCFRNTIQARDKVARRYFEAQKATYVEGRVRGLVDVCLKQQQDETRETGSSWLTDDYVKGLIYDTVAAGMSEMMKTLRLLILLTCHHQDLQSRVQTEIDDVIGSDVPTLAHRTAMPFTQAFILEMLRYVSQTPLAIPHKCNKDVVLDGYLVEKDSGIFPNLWAIHHDEETWGDPWVFRPDRFLHNNALLPSDHKLMQSLIPFSVGKRRCPGQNFALGRTFLIFTSLLQNINFVGSDSEPLPSTDPRLYTSKYPLQLPVFKCRALPRSTASA